MQHVVLDHVPHDPGVIEVLAPAFDANRFRNGELDMVDMVLVPKRLKDAVGKAESEQILHRLFTQVMVDSIDLLLFPIGQNLLVEGDRGREIVAERLFDNDPNPAALSFLNPTLSRFVEIRPKTDGGVAR